MQKETIEEKVKRLQKKYNNDLQYDISVEVLASNLAKIIQDFGIGFDKVLPANIRED